MHKILLRCLTVLGLTVAIASAASSHDAGDLGQTYNTYLAAVKTGNIDRMLSLLTTERRQEVRNKTANRKDKEELIAMEQGMTPDSYEVLHTSHSREGNSSTLYLLAKYSAKPEIGRPAMKSEIGVVYKKENGSWKLDTILYLADPDEVKKLKDDKFTPEDSDTDREGDIGGRIVRVEFKKDYTLVVLLVTGEENAVFLPSREKLSRAGISPDELKPWAVYEFKGHPHKTDTTRFFGTGGKLIED